MTGARRRALIGLAVLGLTATTVSAAAPMQARPGPPPVTAADRVLGRADAPVTVVEYASFVCNHCAHWHLDVLPAFKARFIDTGKVRLVFRNLPTAPAEVSLTAAAIARCVPAERFFDSARALMAGQEALFASQDVQAWFQAAITAGGRSREEVAACVARPETLAHIDADQDGAVAAGVTGTPAFFVNGRRVTDSSLAGLAAAIDPLLAGR